MRGGREGGNRREAGKVGGTKRERKTEEREHGEVVGRREGWACAHKRKWAGCICSFASEVLRVENMGRGATTTKKKWEM